MESNDHEMKHDPKPVGFIEMVAYSILKKTFQDFVPVHHVFLRHQINQSLCASRTWFSLIDRFKIQIRRKETYRENLGMQCPPTQAAPCNQDQRKEQTKTPDTVATSPKTFPTTIDARGVRMEHLTPVHFLRVSRAPPYLISRETWCNTVSHVHTGKMQLSRRWTYVLNRRAHHLHSEIRQGTKKARPWTRSITRRETIQVLTKPNTTVHDLKQYIGTCFSVEPVKWKSHLHTKCGHGIIHILK